MMLSCPGHPATENEEPLMIDSSIRPSAEFHARLEVQLRRTSFKLAQLVDALDDEGTPGAIARADQIERRAVDHDVAAFEVLAAYNPDLEV